MEVSVLNGAGDISQHFRDEVGRERCTDRQVSQHASEESYLGFLPFFFLPFSF